MTPEKDADLCKKYPKIFRDRNGSMQETCMCWGFECGDGWYNIIDRLCRLIQSHIDESIRQNKRSLEVEKKKFSELSWFKKLFFKKTVKEIDPEIIQVVASQVKEKYGSLRFYYYGGDDEIRGMVDMSESISFVTCESCGNPGTQRGTGWIYTLCDKCWSDHQNRKF